MPTTIYLNDLDPNYQFEMMYGACDMKDSGGKKNDRPTHRLRFASAQTACGIDTWPSGQVSTERVTALGGNINIAEKGKSATCRNCKLSAWYG